MPTNQSAPGTSVAVGHDGHLAGTPDQRLGLLRVDRVEDRHVGAVAQRLGRTVRPGCRHHRRRRRPRPCSRRRWPRHPLLEPLDVERLLELRGLVGDEDRDHGRVTRSSPESSAAAEDQDEQSSERAHRGHRTGHMPCHPAASPDHSTYGARRDTESIATASSSTAPVTMKRTDESTLTRLSPVWIAWSTMMPSIAEYADPRPPKSDVPPMTAAAMAVRLVSVVPLACETRSAGRPPAGHRRRRASSTARTPRSRPG